jgi:hypothetical protein
MKFEVTIARKDPNHCMQSESYRSVPVVCDVFLYHNSLTIEFNYEFQLNSPILVLFMLQGNPLRNAGKTAALEDEDWSRVDGWDEWRRFW